MNKKDIAQLALDNLSASKIMELYIAKMYQEVLKNSFLREELINTGVINGD